MAITRNTTAQSTLTDTEKQLVSIIESGVESAISLLERVVNINSGSMNFDGVLAVGQIFDEELTSLGFETRWESGESFGRAGHLFATRGVREPHFLMIGHLDTVFEVDSPFQKFERLAEGTASGPGIIDMKGGDVVIVETLRALHEAGLLDEMTVTVALLGDEESTGRPLDVARASFVEAARAADIALAFEPGDGDPKTAVLARRGFSGWELRVSGVRAHSSAVFSKEMGYGSIFEAARILTRFQEDLAGEELLTFNPGVILGGTAVEYDAEHDRGTAFGKTNVISETTLVAGDLRAISPEQRDRVKKQMEAIVSDNLPKTQATITFRDSYPPMRMTDGNMKLLDLYSQVSQDVGYGPVTAVNPSEAGAADISFAARHVDMALDGLGMMGEGTHTTKEWADLSTLPMQTIRTAVLMHRLARSWSEK